MLGADREEVVLEDEGAQDELFWELEVIVVPFWTSWLALRADPFFTILDRKKKQEHFRRCQHSEKA